MEWKHLQLLGHGDRRTWRTESQAYVYWDTKERKEGYEEGTHKHKPEPVRETSSPDKEQWSPEKGQATREKGQGRVCEGG